MIEQVLKTTTCAFKFTVVTFFICICISKSIFAQYDTYTGFTVPTTPVLPATEVHPSLWFKTDQITALKNKKTSNTYLQTVWSSIQSDLSGYKSTAAADAGISDRPRMAKLSAFSWIMTGDTAAKSKAIACLLIAYDNVPRTSTTADFGNDYDEIYRATWLQDYCDAYDWVQTQLSSTDNTTIRNKIIAEVLLLRNNMIAGAKYAPRPHNHRSKPAWALVTAALTFSSDSRAADWLTFGLTQANTVTKYMFSDDGIYREGSHYFIYSLVNTIPYLWNYKNVSGVDHFPYYKYAFEMPIRIRNGKGWIPNIEDSYVHPVPTHMVAAAYKSTPTTLHPTEPLSSILQWNWANTSFFTSSNTGATNDVVWNVNEYITYDATIPAVMPQINATQRTRSGVVVFRDSDAYVTNPTRYLLFHGVAESDNHEHPDLLSYILEYNNTILATDAGYGKDGSSDAKAAWYTSAAAHNGVTVDTVGPQDISTNVAPKDIQFLTSPFYDFSEKEASTIATSGKIKRGIAFPNKKYWVVYDLGTSTSTPAYRLNIHSRGTMSRTNNQITWTTGTDNYGTPQKLHVLFLTSETNTVTDKTGTTSLWKDEVAQSFVEVKQSKGNAAFLHLLYPDGASSTFPNVINLSSSGVIAFKLSGTGVDLFALQQANTAISVDGLTTNAAFSWVNLESGNVKKYSVTRGTSIKWNSIELLSSSAQITAAVDLSNPKNNIIVFDTLSQSTTIQLLPTVNADSISSVLFNGTSITFGKNNGKISVTVTGYGKLEFLSGITSIRGNDKNIIKKGFGINGNYPNPFNPSTSISFNVNSVHPFDVKVYDVFGREVKILFHGENMIGTYSAKWDGTDNHGANVSSGVYVFELANGNQFDRTKGIFLK